MSLYSDGRAALDRNEFETAEKIFRKGLAAGEIKCAYGLFVHALMSGGEVCDALDELYRHFGKLRMLAEFDGESAFIVGRCYEMGCAVEPDEKQAIRFYQMAADAGYPDAAFNLGCIFANKNEKDTAIRYFELVKESGSHEADDYLEKLREAQR